MTIEGRMAAARAAICSFKKERERLLGANVPREIRMVAEKAHREMQNFLWDALDVYQSSLDQIDLERRCAGRHLPKLSQLHHEWKISEELASELFTLQIEALRADFAEIFKVPPKKCERKKRK
ncbi:MAG TPA: hypothetical protein VFP46_01670 [Candidatus Paceibacterota bacterium]|nr:hypothetical protein [Candidatus Paceibacterota bacterium]